MNCKLLMLSSVLALGMACSPPPRAPQNAKDSGAKDSGAKGSKPKEDKGKAAQKGAAANKVDPIAKRSDAPAPAIPAPYDKTLVGVRLPKRDICATNEDGSLKNPIEPGTYSGLLRNAVCEQQKFITMARVAKSLNVKCNFCHIPMKDKPKAEDYPVHTRRKEIANWMSSTFIQGLKKDDNSPMMCKDCHANKKSRSRSHILGTPRESDFAQEWMGEVMTAAFRHRSGKRLKCKTCHVGMAPGREGWSKQVILKLQVHDENVLRTP